MPNPAKPNFRRPATALALSAAGLVAVLNHESYTDKAIIPIPGDRPTYGFGATFKEDGTPVKMGDTITPPKAIRLAVGHIAKDETVLKSCVVAPVSQAEWDILVDFSYWYGAKRTCTTDVVKFINDGEYKLSCESYLKYKIAAKKDCSIPENKCRGVWLRAQERRNKCIEQL